MNGSDLRLTTSQMASFIANGYVRFDALVERDLCKDVIESFTSDSMKRSEYRRRPLTAVWSEGEPMGRVLRLPRVQAIIESLVGPDPTYDHHAIHTVRPHTKVREALHQDAEYDTRFEHFDIQISFFPHDVSREMGGTLFVPGTHFRRVYESQLFRYQNVLGQVPTVCPAGTMVFWHHNLWHAARSNDTDRMRYMFKVRLNPAVKQVRLWNTADLDDPKAMQILQQSQPWQAQEERRETMNRILLWRSLTGNPQFDLANWWSRIECRPEQVLETAEAVSAAR